MGVIKFGGGTGDFIFRVVDGMPRAVPYAAITPYPDAVGGEPYTSVTDPTGDDSAWPGGTGRALSDGAIPLAHLDYGIAQQPSGVWLDCPDLPRRVWVAAHEGGGSTDGGNGGEYLELSSYLGLSAPDGGALTRYRTGPAGVLQYQIDGAATWTNVDSGGTDTGSDVNTLYVLAWDGSAWKRMSGGAALTSRPAIGTRLILFLSSATGATMPAWAGPNDIALLAT